MGNKQLADMLDVHPTTLSAWESRRCTPSSANLAACRAAFGEELWNWALLQVPELETRERGRPRKL
jgi:transcriptional regulator with XRE-family HTH domain